MASMIEIRTNVFKASQAELAEIAGVTQATVSRWDTNDLFPSGMPILAMLAHAERQGIDLRQSDFIEANAEFNTLTHTIKRQRRVRKRATTDEAAA